MDWNETLNDFLKKAYPFFQLWAMIFTYIVGIITLYVGLILQMDVIPIVFWMVVAGIFAWIYQKGFFILANRKVKRWYSALRKR